VSVLSDSGILGALLLAVLPVLLPEIRLWVEMRKEKGLHERVEACEQEIAALKARRHCRCQSIRKPG
jgi:hypothetical protein